jgi:hypothetical protein
LTPTLLLVVGVLAVGNHRVRPNPSRRR